MCNAARVAAFLGQWHESIGMHRRAVALDPLSAGVHVSLAGSCWRAGLLQEAEAALEKALELDPNAGWVHEVLGYVRLAQRRLDEALEAFQRETNEPHRLLGIALAQHARGEAAEVGGSDAGADR